jgi:hypothetical protein
MHRVIRIICYANDEKEAREKAEAILEDNLVGDNCAFDSGTFFDEDSPVSGSSRWGNLPVVALAESKEGKKLINEGFKYTKDNFIENLKNVKELIKFYNDEELFEEEVLDVKKKILEGLEDKKDNQNLGIRFFKYYCNDLGRDSGGGIFLYNNDGEGIKNTNDLKNVLSKWKTIYEDKNVRNPYEDLKVFVVPVDVHS